MATLIKWFIRGAGLTVPIGLSLYAVWFVARTIDGVLPFPYPGLGLVILLASITFVGFLASRVAFRSAVIATDAFFKKVPVVRLVYTSTKDLVSSFTGQRKSFNRPCVASMSADGSMLALGFVTRDALTFKGTEGMVAVYFPQAYNFAGNVLLFRRDRVRLIDTPSADVMAFVVSGGVSGSKSAADTILPVSMS